MNYKMKLKVIVIELLNQIESNCNIYLKISIVSSSEATDDSGSEKELAKKLVYELNKLSLESDDPNDVYLLFET